jgi:aminopeptidase N
MTLRQSRPLALLCSLLLAVGALAPAGAAAQTEGSNYSISRYALEVELQPDVHQLHARASVTLVAKEPLVTPTFYLNRNLKIEEVVDSAGKPLSFEQVPQADTFSVNLPEPIAAGQSAELTVAYVGAFDPALKPESGPQFAAISSQGTYLLPDSRWFPQSANLWDRFAMTLTVTAPAEETILAPGQAEPPVPAGQGFTRSVFHADQPTLGGTLVAGKFAQVADNAGAPISYYLRTVPETEARANSETLGDIITFFSDTFGPLDNPALAVAETPDDSWDAYTALGLLLLPTRQWTSPINPRLLARYVARLWWAGRASPATPADALLAEGLARYSEALYIEHSAGDEGLHRVLEDLTVGALVDESAAPIANADHLRPYSPAYDSVVRDKGAMVMHMLRLVIGDQHFFQFLHDYAQRFAGRSATLDDFEHLAEEVSGQPLDYFFGEWVRSTGIPNFSLEYVIYRTQKGFRVAGELKQQLEIFRMPIPIRVETEGPPVTQMVEAAGTSSSFSIETFGKPTRIEIDPDFEVLKFTPNLQIRVAIARGEALFQQGKFFEATREYNKALDVKANSSLAQYRMGEAFFAQRNYQAAANAFREAVRGDQEPKWTIVWSYIFLGKIFDLTGQRERAINEYRHALDTKDDTQGAQDEAQKYLQEPYRRESRTIQTIEPQ